MLNAVETSPLSLGAPLRGSCRGAAETEGVAFIMSITPLSTCRFAARHFPLKGTARFLTSFEMTGKKETGALSPPSYRPASFRHPEPCARRESAGARVEGSRPFAHGGKKIFSLLEGREKGWEKVGLKLLKKSVGGMAILPSEANANLPRTNCMFLKPWALF